MYLLSIVLFNIWQTRKSRNCPKNCYMLLIFIYQRNKCAFLYLLSDNLIIIFLLSKFVVTILLIVYYLSHISEIWEYWLTVLSLNRLTIPNQRMQLPIELYLSLPLKLTGTVRWRMKKTKDIRLTETSASSTIDKFYVITGCSEIFYNCNIIRSKIQ